LDEQLRAQMTEHLGELRTLLDSDSHRSPELGAALLAHVAELEALLAAEEHDAHGVQRLVESLEQKLLGWEAEHPQWVALVARVTRALESAGM